MQPVDEYNPNAKNMRWGVRSDDSVYIYDNVRTCIAVAVTDSANSNMIAVHLTVASGMNSNELDGVVAKIRAALKGPVGGIYMIGPWSSVWRAFPLLTKLRGISQNIHVADVMAVNAHQAQQRAKEPFWKKKTVVTTNMGADVDAKMEKSGVAVNGYVKPLKAVSYMRVEFQRV